MWKHDFNDKKRVAKSCDSDHSKRSNSRNRRNHSQHSKKAVKKTVKGFMGILDNIDDFGEPKRRSRRHNSSRKSSICSCKKSNHSNDNKKVCCKKKPINKRKISISLCSGSESKHTDKTDHSRKRCKRHGSSDWKDSGDESDCSRKTIHIKGRRLAECE